MVAEREIIIPMNKDERILKKVGKLLKLYGVPDEEKEKFLADLQDKKYDDQDDLNEPEEIEETEEVEEENPTEEVGEEEVEEQEVSEDAEEPAETEPTEEPVEEPLPEEPMAEEPMAEEQPPVEENPMEQPQTANDPRVEEMSKTIEGLLDRIASLEDIVKKLGTPVEENIGVEPHNPSGESLQESELDRYNKLRMGR